MDNQLKHDSHSLEYRKPFDFYTVAGKRRYRPDRLRYQQGFDDQSYIRRYSEPLRAQDRQPQRNEGEPDRSRVPYQRYRHGFRDDGIHQEPDSLAGFSVDARPGEYAPAERIVSPPVSMFSIACLGAKAS